jgi:hypothetical protein
MTTSPALSAAEQARAEEVAVQYLTREKGWQRQDFRVEHQGVSGDAVYAIVWAIHLDDERKPLPGGGKSLELFIDRAQQRVAKEYGFQ